MIHMNKRILIVGGGFAGIKTALELSKKNLHDTTITLVSDKPHFEYHALLYRVLTGRSPLEVCIPLADIFKDKKVDIVQDFIVDADLKNKTLRGSSNSTYHYDILVLALGSEPSFFNTPGLKEMSYSINTIESTLKLKRHLHEIFLQCQRDNSEDKNCSAHIIIVGGGPTGVESAGELALYARQLANRHGVDPSFVTIDLIQSGNRLMPMLDAESSEAIRKRLYSLGVNIFLNRRLMKEELETVYLKDMEMKTKTLIWCAGVSPNTLYKTIKDLTLDEKGRVIVDEHLLAQGVESVYIAGDGAATEYTGMAQTALIDGAYIANDIIHLLNGKLERPLYTPKTPSYLIPVGEGWAVGKVNGRTSIGYAGWLQRKWFDLKFFLSILPLSKALLAFQSDKVLWESCPICSRSVSMNN